MAGIYIHIPFCKQACHYCNFHFSTSTKYSQEMVNAIIREIGLRKDYLGGQPIRSVYFGGGTPSMLATVKLETILRAIRDNLFTMEDCEITLEANPDDLSPVKMKELAEAGINRLSIGIQSFQEDDLVFMHRSHDRSQALECIRHAQDQGFTNISADLIFGAHTTDDADWIQNLTELTAMGIQHLSCYALTIEPRTVFYKKIKSKKLADVDDEKIYRQFYLAKDYLEERGFEHYEISNYAINQMYSRHNTAYWSESPYLGIGPSAHSYNKKERSWNVADNKKYIDMIRDSILPMQTEILTNQQKFNEYIMTRLRTQWGLDGRFIKDKFPNFYKHFRESIKKHIQRMEVKQEGQYFKLTRKGMIFADSICSDLFILQ